MISGEQIHIPRPAVSAERQSKAFSWFIENGTNPTFTTLISKAESPIYQHWVKLRFITDLPAGLTPEEFWDIVKLSRQLKSEPTPLRSEKGIPFKWVKTTDHQRFLHQLDLNTGGTLLGIENLDTATRRSFIASSLIEEAIASSQLEGAHTTRKEARKLILENREPADKDQRMIVNNHKTMELIENEYKNSPLSLELILEMHKTLTAGAIDAGKPGVFRKNEDNIYVSGGQQGEIAHVPPPMEFVEGEITRLIAYANTKSEDETNFVHPVIKAIFLHFWIGYLHPFTDGNGRLARSLFYWYLLRNGYWAFAFIPISTRIRLSAKSYGKAYLYTEQDDNDLTYFIDYNLRQIRLSVRDFQKFYEEKRIANKNLRKLSDLLYDFNDRQIQLIKHMSGDPLARTNVSSHQQLHGVSQMTAISDLKSLSGDGLLTSRRQGRNVFYYPTEKLFKLVERVQADL